MKRKLIYIFIFLFGFTLLLNNSLAEEKKPKLLFEKELTNYDSWYGELLPGYTYVYTGIWYNNIEIVKIDSKYIYLKEFNKIVKHDKKTFDVISETRIKIDDYVIYHNDSVIGIYYFKENNFLVKYNCNGELVFKTKIDNEYELKGLLTINDKYYVYSYDNNSNIFELNVFDEDGQLEYSSTYEISDNIMDIYSDEKNIIVENIEYKYYKINSNYVLEKSEFEYEDIFPYREIYRDEKSIYELADDWPNSYNYWINKYSLDGELEKTFDVSDYVREFYCVNNYCYIFGYFGLIITDRDLNVIDTLDVSTLSIFAIKEYNNLLYIFSTDDSYLYLKGTIFYTVIGINEEEENALTFDIDSEIEINLQDVFETLSGNFSDYDWQVKDKNILQIDNGKIIPLTTGETTISTEVFGDTYSMTINITSEKTNNQENEVKNPKTSDILLLSILAFVVSLTFYLYFREKTHKLE